MTLRLSGMLLAAAVLGGCAHAPSPAPLSGQNPANPSARAGPAIPSRAHREGKVLLQDKLDGHTKGLAVGIRWMAGQRGGKAAAFTSRASHNRGLLGYPAGRIGYPSEDFSRRAGSISFDLKFLIRPPKSHRAWCIFSDVSPVFYGAYYGALDVEFPANSDKLRYGIWNGSWQWLYSQTSSWKVGRWYRVHLRYGPGGMRLQVNGKLEANNNSTEGLAATAKSLGYSIYNFGEHYTAAPVAVKNFTTRRVYVNNLEMSCYTMNPYGGGTFAKPTIRYELAKKGNVTLKVLAKNSHVVKILVAHSERAAGDHSLIWHAHGLADGQYQLRLSIRYGASHITRQAAFWVDTRWRWHKPHTWVNHFFATGVYYMWEDAVYSPQIKNDPANDPVKARRYFEGTMKDLRQHGINTVFNFGVGTYAAMALDVAHRNKIRMIGGGLDSPVGNFIYSATVGRDTSRSADLYEVVSKAIMKGITGKPAFSGYYLVDEPGPYQMKRELLINQILEAEDPEHPAFSSFAWHGSKAVIATPGLQVLLMDAYPIFTSFRGDFSDYISMLKKAQSDARGRPLWVAPQAFGQGIIRPTWKIPTTAEIRAQAWLAVAYGAKGVIWFIYQSTTKYQGEWLHGLVNTSLKPTRRWATVGHLNAEFDRLAPLLLQWRPVHFPIPALKREKVIDKAFTDRAGNRYVIFVNTDVKRAISIPWRIKGAVALPQNQPVGPRLLLRPGAGAIIKLVGQ